MAYVYENLNPKNQIVGDCAIRAVAKACGLSWDEAYTGLTDMGFYMKNLPNANTVWGAFLKAMGFVKCSLPNTCPDCLTVRQFTEDNPRGVYVLCTGTHVVTAIDGDFFDIWNSGDEPIAFYYKEVNL